MPRVLLAVAFASSSAHAQSAPPVLAVAPHPIAVTEGGSAEFTVALGEQPGGDGEGLCVGIEILPVNAAHGVTIAPAASANANGDGVMSFCESDAASGDLEGWQVPRTVMISAAHDDDTQNGSIIVAFAVDADSTNALNYLVASYSWSRQIIVTDDDAVVPSELAVADVSAAEADGALVFTVTSSPESEQAITVEYQSSDGTATAGEPASAGDYVAASGTLTIAANASQAYVTVTVQDDATAEVSETLTLTLSNPSSNASLGATSTATYSATGTIVNDDDLPTIGFDSAEEIALEDEEEAFFDITLSGGTLVEPASVVLTVLPGTASATADGASPWDYRAGTNPRTITFTPGGSAWHEVLVEINYDSVHEPEERFTVVLESPVGAQLGTATAVGRIFDEDGPPEMRVSVDEFAHLEGTNGALRSVFTIRANQLSSRDVTVAYQTVDGTAIAERYEGHIEDYTAVSGTLTMEAYTGVMHNGSVTTGPFAANQQPSFPITVEVNDDDWIDATVETFTFTLVEIEDSITVDVGGGATASQANAGLHSVSSQTVNIHDGSATSRPRLVVQPDGASSLTVQVDEGDDDADVQLVLGAVPTTLGAVLVLEVDDSGSALVDADAATVRFEHAAVNRWDVPRTVLITAHPDPDMDDEEIIIPLRVDASSSPAADTGYPGAGETAAMLTVVIDDQTPQIEVEVVDARAAEADGYIVFTVERSDDVATETRVAYQTSDGTATAGAAGAAGSDYTAASGTLTIAGGEDEGTVTVMIASDENDEEDETFSLTLLGSPHATLGAMSVATGTIEDGEGGVSILSIAITSSPSQSDCALAVFSAPEHQMRPCYIADDVVEVDVRFSRVMNVTGDASDVPALNLWFNGGERGASYSGGSGTDTLTFAYTVQVGDIDYSGVSIGSFAEPGPAGTGLEAEGVAVTSSQLTVSEFHAHTNLSGHRVNGAGNHIRLGMAFVAPSSAGMVFRASLSDAVPDTATSPLRVDYTTVDGTATAGQDYAATEGTLSFAAGQHEHFITVPVIAPSMGGSRTVGETVSVQFEGDPRRHADITSVAHFSAAYHYFAQSATGTIPPTPMLSVAEEEAPEARGQLVFTITSSESAHNDITVQYQTSDDTATAGEPALAGDYVAASGTLTIAAGSREETITVTVTDDAVEETDESFTFTLSNPTHALLAADPSATGTIDNDDVEVSILSATVTSSPSQEDCALGNQSAPEHSMRPCYIADDVIEARVRFSRIVDVVNADDVPVLNLRFSGQNRGASYTGGSGTDTLAFAYTVQPNDRDETGIGFGTFADPGATGTGLEVNGVALTSTHLDISAFSGPNLSGHRVNATGNHIRLGMSFVAPTSDGMVFRAWLSDAVPETATAPLTVDYVTVDNTATAGEDYVETNGTLSYLAGQHEHFITVPVIGSRTEEEPVSVRFSGNPRRHTDITPVSSFDERNYFDRWATDPIPPTSTVSVADASAPEADGELVFTISRLPASAAEAVVTYQTSDGAATAADDYVQSSGTLTIAANASEGFVTIAVTDENAEEADEAFSLTLTLVDTPYAVLGAMSSVATGTIENDDVDISVLSASFTSSPPQQDCALDNQSAPQHAMRPCYIAGDVVEAQVRFSRTVDVVVDGDEVPVLNLWFSDSGGNRGAAYTGGSGTDTLTFAYTVQPGDRDYIGLGFRLFVDPGPTGAGFEVNGTRLTNALLTSIITPFNHINILDHRVNAAGNHIRLGMSFVAPTSDGMVFRAWLSDAVPETATLPLTVDYVTVDNTATAGEDYVETNGTLSYFAGQHEHFITVPVIGTRTESERVSVRFDGNPQRHSDITPVSHFDERNYFDRWATDPIPPTSTVTVADASAPEADGEIVFTVSRLPASAAEAMVTYQTSDGSVGATGSDYTAASGTLTIAANASEGFVTVTVTDEETVETDETFSLTLALVDTPYAALGSSSVATGTIEDDDAPPPELTVADASAPEADGELVFTITASHTDFDDDITVEYQVSDGTATAGDYTAASGTLTLAAGTREETINVTVTDDDAEEADETLTFTLSNATQATLGTPSVATGTIENDDVDVVIVSATITSSPSQSDCAMEDYSAALYFVQPCYIAGDVIEAQVRFSRAVDVVVDGDNVPALNLRFGGENRAAAYTGGSGTDTVTFEYTVQHGQRDYTGISIGTFADAQGADTGFEVDGIRLASTHLDGIASFGGSDLPGHRVNATGNHIRLQLEFVGATATGVAFRATLSDAVPSTATSPLTVEYTTEDFSAIAGVDYVATSGTLSFAAGEDEHLIDVPVIAPSMGGARAVSGTMRVRFVGHPQAYADVTPVASYDSRNYFNLHQDGYIPITSTVRILNDESVLEANGELVFTIRRTPGTSTEIAVEYQTSDGTATADDYTAASGTLTFVPYDWSETVTVAVTDDAIEEAGETLSLTITLPETPHAVLGSMSVATGTIENDDVDVSIVSATVTSSPSQVDCALGNFSAPMNSRQSCYIAGNMIRVQVRFSHAVDVVVDGANVPVLNLRFDGSDRGAAYNGGSGTDTLTFLYFVQPGDVDYTGIGIGTFADPQGADTGFEVSGIRLTSTHLDGIASFGGSDLSGHRVNATGNHIRFAVGYDVPTEAGLVFWVALSDTVPYNTTSPLTVEYATEDATATAGVDYEATSGTLSFSAGQLEHFVTVPVIAPSMGGSRASDLSMRLGLDNPQAYSDGTSVGAYDANNFFQQRADGIVPATSTFTVQNASASEADGELVFTITRDEGSIAAVAVEYQTSDGTIGAAGAATADDYTAASGTLTFAAQEWMKTVAVAVTDDAIVEVDETLSFALTLPETPHAVLGTPSVATGTIEDDDDVAVISAAISSTPSQRDCALGSFSAPETVRRRCYVTGDAIVAQVRFSDAIDVATSGDEVPGLSLALGSETRRAVYTAGSGTDTLTFAYVVQRGDRDFNGVGIGAFPDPQPTGTGFEADGEALAIADLNTATALNGADMADHPVNATGNHIRLDIDNSFSHGTDIVFTVDLSDAVPADATSPLRVNYTATVTGGAVNATSSGTLTFAAGQDIASLTVPIAEAPEVDLEVAVELDAAPTAYSAPYAVAAFDAHNYFDRTASGEVLTSSLVVVEGTAAPEGAGALVFTVTVLSTQDDIITVPYSTGNGSARAGDDFTATSDTLTIAAGASVGHITVTVQDDDVVEDDETLRLFIDELSSNASLGDADAFVTGTIENDDVHVSVLSAAVTSNPPHDDCALGSQSAAQGAMRPCYAAGDAIDVEVRFSRNVDVTESNGDAPSLDLRFGSSARQAAYISGTGTDALTFRYVVQAGDRDFDGITIGAFTDPPPAGTAFEVDGQSVAMAEVNAAGAGHLGTNNLGGHRVNGLGNHIRIGIGDGELVANGMVFTVNLSDAVPTTATSALRVAYTTEPENTTSPLDAVAALPGIAAPVDDEAYFSATSGTLSFAAGEDAQTVTVAILNTPATAETFTMRLSGDPVAHADVTQVGAFGSHNYFDDTGQGSIPVASTLSISDASAGESEGTMEFTVTANAPPVFDITAQVETTPGTATAPGDYTPINGTLTVMRAGETQGIISVTLSDDSTAEDDETFTLTVRGPSMGARFDNEGNTATVTGTIPRNDGFRTVQFAGDPAPVSEGDGEVVFTLQLAAGDEPLTEAATVQFTLHAGSALGAANGDAPRDYDPGDNPRTITLVPAGSPTWHVAVAIDDDEFDEGRERFRAELSSASGIHLGADTSAFATILDDDEPPVMRMAGPTTRGVSEAGGPEIVFTIEADRPSSRDVTVAYETVSITARAERHAGQVEDYHAVRGTLTMAAYTGAMDDGTASTGPFEAGQTPSFPVTVRIHDDHWLDDGGQGSWLVNPYATNPVPIDDETFSFTLGVLHDPVQVVVQDTTTESLSNATVDAQAFEVVVSIEDDEAATTLPRLIAAPVAAHVLDLNVLEGGSARYELALAHAPQPNTVIVLDMNVEDYSVGVSASPDGPIEFGHDADNYWNVPRTITVSAAEDDDSQSRTFPIPHELDEALTTSGPPNVPNLTRLTLNVIDSDAPVPTSITLTATPSSAPEPTNGTSADGVTDVVLTATFPNNTGLFSTDTEVAIGFESFSANPATDYAVASNLTLTIPPVARQGTLTFPFTVLHDTAIEASEAVSISGTASGFEIAPTSITIRDNDDPMVAIAPPDAVTEGAAEIVFTVTSNVIAAGPVLLEYNTSSDETSPVAAEPNVDYTETSDTVRIGDPNTVEGATDEAYITVALGDDDNLYEGPREEFTLDVLDRHTGARVSVTATILENDAEPSAFTLTATPSTVTEEGGARDIALTLAIDGDTVHEDRQEVQIRASAGTATETVDYLQVANVPLTIPAGAAQGEATFSFEPVDDTIFDQDETVILEAVRGSTVIGTATLTIGDNDGQPTTIELTATPSSASEPTRGMGPNTVVVSVEAAYPTGGVVLAVPTEVTVTLAEGSSMAGTAVAGDDFASVAPFTVTIAAGATQGSGEFTLQVADDAIHEGDETITVSGSASGFTVADAVLTIEDNDERPTGITLSSITSFIDEEAGETALTVRAVVEGDSTFASEQTVQLTFAANTLSSGPGSTPPIAFEPLQDAAITIPAGAAEASAIIAFTPIDDATDQADDDTSVTVSGVISAAGVSVTPFDFVLVDNDNLAVSVQLSVHTSTITESSGEAEITVTATLARAMTHHETAVAIAVTDGTATSDDYAVRTSDGLPLTVTIAPGAMTATAQFTLVPTDDSRVEEDETVLVTGTSTSRGIGDVQGASITIADNDVVTVNIADSTAIEGDAAMVFTVTASQLVDGGSVVSYGTQAGSDDEAAEEGNDYIASNGDVTVGDSSAPGGGSLSATITIPLGADDVLYEGEHETFSVTVSAGSERVQIGTGTATGTITENDAEPDQFTLTATPNAVAENSGTTEISVTVRIDGAVAYADERVMQVGASSTTATENVDFAQVADFPLTIPAGALEGTATFDLEVRDDMQDDDDETVKLSIPGIASTHIAIDDDEGTPTTIVLSASPATAPEPAGGGAQHGDVSVVITAAYLTSDTMLATDNVVAVTVAGGSAESGEDFTTAAASFPMTIAANSTKTTHTLTLGVTHDDIHEGDETIIISGVVTTQETDIDTVREATITITDNDAAPTAIALSGSTANGGNGPIMLSEGDTATEITITATLRGGGTLPGNTPVTVNILGSGGDHVVDFGATPSPLTIDIPAGRHTATGTFTITPVQDALAGGDETISISATTSSGLPVNGGFDITLADDDEPPTNIALQVNPAHIDEAADTAAMAITAAFAQDGVMPDAVEVAISMAGDTASAQDFAAATGMTVTIPGGASSGTAILMVSPVADDIAEHDETILVDGTAPGFAVASATLTVVDDDAAGLVLTDAAGQDLAPSATLAVREGINAGYGVQLAKQPTTPVTVTVTSSDADEVTVSTGDTLVFTPQDWDGAQWFTLSGVPDEDHQGGAAAITLAVTSTAPKYADLADVVVQATVADGDAPGLAVEPRQPSVAEQGSATYAVHLTARPSAAVTVDLNLDGDVTITSPLSLTFEADAWNTPQHVTIAGVGDDDYRDEQATITHAATSLDAAYQALADDPIIVAIIDDDAPGMAFTLTDMALAEDGTASYGISLAAQPSAPVTVDLTPDGDVTVTSSRSLVFEAQAWSAPQQVTIAGVHDDGHQDEAATITHAASSLDAGYAALAAAPVTVAIIDDDEPGVAFTPTDMTMHENGTAQYGVRLETQPSDEVTLTLTPSDAEKATATPELMLFAQDDWNVLRTVTIAALDDADDQPAYETITHALRSTDAGYNNTTAEMPLTIFDDDLGLVLTDASGDPLDLTAPLETEEGGAITYGVRLQAEPLGTTTVTIAASDAAKATVQGTALTFTADDWQAIRNVTLAAREDADARAETVAITHAASSDAADFGNPAPVELTLAIADNDEPGLTIAATMLCIAEAHAAGTNASQALNTAQAADASDASDDAQEGQATDASDASDAPGTPCPAPISTTASYTLALNSQPSQAVTVALASTQDAPWLALSARQLTFAPQDWNAPQTVTIRAALSDDDGRDETAAISHAITSADAQYAALEAASSIASVRVTMVDDDEPGLTINPASRLLVTEQAFTTYTMQLATAPLADVTITMARSERAAFTPASLTFGSADWNAPQTITLHAPSDDDAANNVILVTHTARSLDADYEGLLQTLAVGIADIDPPRLTTIAMDDQAAPNVGTTFGFGEEIRLVAGFSRPVQIHGRPQLRITMGSTPRLANYVVPAPEGTGGDEPASQAAQQHAFAYTIQADDETDGGIDIPANPLVVNAAEGDAIVAAENPELKAEKETAEFEVAEEIMDRVRVEGNRDFMLSANAGEDIETREGAVVTLVGEGITSGDASELAYRWTQRIAAGGQHIGQDNGQAGDADERREERSVGLRVVPGARHGSGAVATFTAPNDLTFTTRLTFVLEVMNPQTDDEPKYDEMEVLIAATNGAPLANAGEDQTAEEGATVVLDGSQSLDPEGKPLAFSWAQKAGNEPRVELQNADQARATFIAPEHLYEDARLDFVLTVTDLGGLTATDEVAITVRGQALTRVLGHALARFGRAVGTGAVDAVSERFHASSGRQRTFINLGGTQVDATQRLLLSPDASSTGKASGHGGADGAVLGDTDGAMIGDTDGADAGYSSGDPTGTDGMASGSKDGVGAGHGTRHGHGHKSHHAAHGPGNDSGHVPQGKNLLHDDVHFEGRLHRFTQSMHDWSPNRDFLMRSSFEIGLGGPADASSALDADGALAADGSGSLASDHGGSLAGDGSSLTPDRRSSITRDKAPRARVDWALWGRADQHRFEASPTPSLAMNGNVQSSYIGLDRTLSDRGLMGLAVSQSSGDMRFQEADRTGEIAMRLTSAYPYANRALTKRMDGWAMLGAGQGDAAISTGTIRAATDIDMRMAAGGLSNAIITSRHLDLAVKADAFMLTMHSDKSPGLKPIDTTVRRFRLALKATNSRQIGTSHLQPSLTLSGRMDEGDAETGFGIEMNAGIAYNTRRGLTMEARTRRLLTHAQAGLTERGTSLTLRYDPGRPGGLALAVAPTWGTMQSRANQMWQADELTFKQLTNTGQDTAQPFAMNANLSYGFTLRKWTVEPYGEFNMGGTSDREQWGVRLDALEMATGKVSFEFFGEWRGTQENPAFAPGVKGTLRFEVR